MKKGTNILLSVLLIVVAIGLAIPAVMFIRSNDISIQNGLISDARDNYQKGEFIKAHNVYEHLIDSLGFADDAAILNYGNAAFQSAEVLKAFFEGKKDQQEVGADSAALRMSLKSKQQYFRLVSAKNNTVRAMASNQIGYGMILENDVFASSNPDSVLAESLNYFKDALRADPTNDSVRHNYELIKKILGYPETVLAETKALIAQKRYREAEYVLTSGMRRDPRLRGQEDFLQRLQTVIRIDSLDRK